MHKPAPRAAAQTVRYAHGPALRQCLSIQNALTIRNGVLKALSRVNAFVTLLRVNMFIDALLPLAGRAVVHAAAHVGLL